MLGRVGDRKAGPLRQNLNAAFALRKLLQQFQPMTMTERFRNRSELSE